MAFDFKKEYKEFYMPKNKPEMLLFRRLTTLLYEEKAILTRLTALISRQSASYTLLLTR